MGWREDVDAEYGVFSKGETWLLMELSNFFDNPRSPREFRSLHHVGKVFEQTVCPSRRVEKVLSKMLDLHILVINNNGFVIFNNKAFDQYFESLECGRIVWEYIGRQVEYVRK